MSTLRMTIAWTLALLMTIALVPVPVIAELLDPIGLSAASVVSGDDDDDDGGGEDDGGGDDEGDDDGGEALPPPVATFPPSAPTLVPQIPAVTPTAVDNGSEDDDDDDRSGGDDDDLGGLDVPVADQAIIQLAEGEDPYDFAERTSTTLIRVILSENIIQLELDRDEDDELELGRLVDEPEVVWAELNYTSQAPEGRPRYFFTSTSGEPVLVDGPALPDGLEFSPSNACVTGDGVVVAVLDTGIETDHPAFDGQIAPGGLNLLDSGAGIEDIGNDRDDDRDGQVDEMVGHGTHVSGTVLQVAPDALILPIKVLDSDGVGDAFALTAGVVHAVNAGADVINLSLGSTFDSMAVRAAVDYATERDVVIIAAAGNGDRELPLEYPAATDPVISVSATDADGDKAGFSNFNSEVDISAPGVDVASAYTDGRYVTASGTSMSTPLISALVALMLEQEPDSSPVVVTQRMLDAAGPLSLTDESHDGLLGAGELDIDTTLACSSE